MCDRISKQNTTPFDGSYGAKLPTEAFASLGGGCFSSALATCHLRWPELVPELLSGRGLATGARC